MRDAIATALDVLGLLLVSIGLAFFLWPYMGGGALLVSGGLIMGASALADRPPTRRRRNRREAQQ